MKLDDRDTAVLALLGGGPATADELAADLGRDPAALAERLAELADNGLVTERGDGTVERTDSGRRVLVASGSGAVDNRLDTTEADERALAAFDLGPDGAEAVRAAFAVLRYWGEVTAEELTDAVFAEEPAGYDDGERWWAELVREPLAALPAVVPPGGTDEPWRYAGVPEVARPTADGRRVLDPAGPLRGSVKDAVETLGLTDDERAAVHAAFSVLKRRRTATGSEIADAVYPDHPAGYDAPEAWRDGLLGEAFGELPHVERDGDGRWRYRQPPAWRTRRREDGEVE